MVDRSYRERRKRSVPQIYASERHELKDLPAWVCNGLAKMALELLIPLGGIVGDWVRFASRCGERLPWEVAVWGEKGWSSRITHHASRLTPHASHTSLPKLQKLASPHEVAETRPASWPPLDIYLDWDP